LLDIRRIIYTTNTIEGFRRQVRKVTKNKGVLPSEDALLKLVYLAYKNISKKWTQLVSLSALFYLSNKSLPLKSPPAKNDLLHYGLSEALCHFARSCSCRLHLTSKLYTPTLT